MTEYAILSGGEIVNVSSTSAPIDEVKKRFPNHTVKPLDSVPLAVKQRYRYWNERP